MILLGVRIIARSTLVHFVQGLEGSKDQRSVKAALESWFHEVRRAKWNNSADIKAVYASASIIGAERVVFNIKGNAYRLVTAVDYQRAIIFIKWLGTHREYDNINARTISYEANKN
jgi:mRNA interferase HigB